MFISTLNLVVAIVVLSLAILIEATLAYIIIEMNRWNVTTRVVLTLALLDIMSFVFNMVAWILYEQDRHTTDKYDFNLSYAIYTIPIAIIQCSVAVSLILSYSVLYILRYRQIFNVSEASWLYKLAFFITLLIPIVLYANAYSAYVVCVKSTTLTADDVLDDSKKLDCSNAEETTLGDLNFAWLFYGGLLIFINFFFFCLSLYYSRQILFEPGAVSVIGTPNSHQEAIAVLVTRMKYYSIIQASLYMITVFVNQYSTTTSDSSAFLMLLYLIPPLAYLFLFLTMQPHAKELLMKKLQICFFCRTETTSADQAISSAKVKNSITTRLVSNEASLQAPLALCSDLETLEDEDIQKLISSFSNINTKYSDNPASFSVHQHRKYMVSIDSKSSFATSGNSSTRAGSEVMCIDMRNSSRDFSNDLQVNEFA